MCERERKIFWLLSGLPTAYSGPNQKVHSCSKIKTLNFLESNAQLFSQAIVYRPQVFKADHSITAPRRPCRLRWWLLKENIPKKLTRNVGCRIWFVCSVRSGIRALFGLLPSQICKIVFEFHTNNKKMLRTKNNQRPANQSPGTDKQARPQFTYSDGRK